MKILGIIPARYGSTRFPGKPLVDIDGKTMIQRVYEQAKSCSTLTDVIVATDDQRIVNEVTRFGGKVTITSTSHQSGTDRCAEVVSKLTTPYEIVINIQGDEPFIDPKQITQLCNCFKDKKTQIATLVKRITDSTELLNENKVKVTFNKNHFAIYFSRNAIPFYRGENHENWIKNHQYFKHLGIYGYKTKILKEITLLKPSKLELAEGLEQLRWLENGYNIKIAETELETISIDTPEDIVKLK